MKYNYGPESLISRVEIVRTETGAKRAYLESAPNADKAKLTEVRAALAKHGYLTVPIEVGGKPLLEIRKFTSQESLLKQLGEAGGISGVPAQQMAVQDRVGMWQWIKNNTYKACLGFYFIGDVGFSIYGHYKNKNQEAKDALAGKAKAAKKHFLHSDHFDEYAGYAYMAGTTSSIISTALRGDQSDEEVQAISEKLRLNMREEKVENLSSTYKAIEDDAKEHSLLRIKQFFVKHPAEILNVCYAAAGAFLAYASHGHYKRQKPDYLASKAALMSVKETKITSAIEAAETTFANEKKKMRVAIQDMALGSITLFSGTASSLIKERPKNADEKEPTGVFAKVWRWIEEKPLRLAASGYLLSTGIHINSTYHDYKRIHNERTELKSKYGDTSEHVKLLKDERGLTHARMLFCVTNIIAEILMALSSKGHGEGVKSDATVETSATAIAAENIALQAPEKREELIEKFAQHLASPKVMGGSSVMIARGIRANLKSLDSNPWADAVAKPVTAANDPVYTTATLKPAAEFTQRVAEQAAANDAQYSVPAVG